MTSIHILSHFAYYGGVINKATNIPAGATIVETVKMVFYY
jgi:hypothetical protein